MPSYETAIAWIAEHDAAAIDELSHCKTVALVADLFGVDEPIVVQHVRSARAGLAVRPQLRSVADVRRAGVR